MASPNDILPGTKITRKQFGEAIERAIFPNGENVPNHAFLTQTRVLQKGETYTDPEGNSRTAQGGEVVDDPKQFRISQTDTLTRAAKALKGEPFSDTKGAPTKHTQAGNGLFLLPPRTGKTVTFGTLAKIGADNGVRSVILVPTTDLIKQTRDKLLGVCGFGDVSEAEKIAARDAATKKARIAKINASGDYSATLTEAELAAIEPKDITRDIGVLYGETTDSQDKEALRSKVLITTYDSFRNLVKAGSISPQTRPFVIADEAHKAIGDTTKGTLDQFIAAGGLVQGWTATPEIKGKTVNDALFAGDPAIMEREFIESVKAREVTPVQNIVFATDYETKALTAGISDEDKAAEKVVGIAGRSEAAVDTVFNFINQTEHRETGETRELHFANVPQIWYTAGLQSASHVAQLLNAKYDAAENHSRVTPLAAGARSADSPDTFSQYAFVISGKTKDYYNRQKTPLKYDEHGQPILSRQEIMKAYAEGRIRCLVSADLLVEGYDFPNCELTVMLRPVKSKRICIQAGSRSTAKDASNPDKIGYVASFVDKDDSSVQIFGKAVTEQSGGSTRWMAPTDSTPEPKGFRSASDQEHALPSHIEKVCYSEADRIPFDVEMEARTAEQQATKAARAEARDATARRARNNVPKPDELYQPNKGWKELNGIRSFLEKQSQNPNLTEEQRQKFVMQIRRFGEIQDLCKTKLQEACGGEEAWNDITIRKKSWATFNFMGGTYQVRDTSTRPELVTLEVRTARLEKLKNEDDYEKLPDFSRMMHRTFLLKRPKEFADASALESDEFINQYEAEDLLYEHSKASWPSIQDALDYAIKHYEQQQVGRECSMRQLETDRVAEVCDRGIVVACAKEPGKLPGYYFSKAALLEVAAKLPEGQRRELPSTVVTHIHSIGEAEKALAQFGLQLDFAPSGEECYEVKPVDPNAFASVGGTTITLPSDLCMYNEAETIARLNRLLEQLNKLERRQGVA